MAIFIIEIVRVFINFDGFYDDVIKLMSRFVQIMIKLMSRFVQ
jgi:DNA-directed RNA polymerase alpha subunit